MAGEKQDMGASGSRVVARGVLKFLLQSLSPTQNNNKMNHKQSVNRTAREKIAIFHSSTRTRGREHDGDPLWPQKHALH